MKAYITNTTATRNVATNFHGKTRALNLAEDALEGRAGMKLKYRLSGSFTGWATSLIENFGEGRYLGVPLLQRYGMSIEPRLASERGVEPYPHMIRWLR